MSSWLELQEWYLKHAVHSFPWQEWIEELQHTLPIPVYDITRILDTCQAYDMAVHAAHWPCDKDIQQVNIPPKLVQHINALGLQHSRQVVYMARALYSHCSRYVTNMPLVCCPPTAHIDELDAIPRLHLLALARATLTPFPAKRLHTWLAAAIMYGCRHVHRVHSTYRSDKPPGRKGRKHSASAEARDVAEKAVAGVNQAFAGIVALSPRFAPRFGCHVTSVAPGHITLVLSAVPHVPFDE